MKAKFVYEAMDDVLKGKSEEEIMSSLEKSSDLDLNDLLINAAAAGFLPGVKKALERGADVHYGENSALRRASLYGHYDVVEFLLKNGALLKMPL